jgi:hypothetical protein
MATVEVNPARFVERFNMKPQKWQEQHPGTGKYWVFRFRFAKGQGHLGLFHFHGTWERAEKEAVAIAERYMTHLVVDVLG